MPLSLWLATTGWTPLGRGFARRTGGTVWYNCHYMYKCSRCQRMFTREALVIYKNGVVNGKRYTYYACRPCKNESVHYAHPGRSRAREKVRRAIRANKLRRRTTCQVRGCVLKPEAHHPDHSRPLAILWLCRTHHAEAARLLRQHHI